MNPNDDDNPTESSPLLSRSSSSPAPATTRIASIGPPIYINPPTQQQQQPSQMSQQPPSSLNGNSTKKPTWPTPVGLPPRSNNDENLIIFRRAIGINSNLSSATTSSASAAADYTTIEEGHRRKNAIGMYRAVLRARRSKQWQYHATYFLVIFCHFAQIIIGASLTALGPLAGSSNHGLIITLLGALNTILAGVLALISGQGIPDRIQKDEVGYRKIQDWIEETESLLAVGVIGRDRKEVGLLVEEAFRKWNAAKANEENNRPSEYVNGMEEATGAGHVSQSHVSQDTTANGSATTVTAAE